MKFVLVPDKFKGSLTGMEFCDAVEEGFKTIRSNAEIVKLPLADGGDGTIEVVNFYLKGEVIQVVVKNPFFQPVNASYLYTETSKIAFIEMAEASGVKLLKHEQLDCKNATTFGTGELILDAIEKGAIKIIVGIGGSATNDCGIGMATALGYRFLDKNNDDVKPIGANLSKIKSIDDHKVHPKLNQIHFQVACDVTNPLYGTQGAAFVYAAQKGATKADIKTLDKGLKDFSEVLDNHFKIQSQAVSGAGAAGGMGIGTKLFLNANLESGINLIKKLADFDNQLEGVDWIITGEGKLDSQTLSGKTIHGVIDSAKKKNIKVAAFCGAIDLDKKAIEDFGISYSASIMNKAINFEDAVNNTSKYLKEISIDFSNRIKNK